MDKKYLIVGITTIFILAGAGCNKTINNAPAPQPTKQEVTKNQVTNVVKQEQPAPVSNVVVEPVKEENTQPKIEVVKKDEIKNCSASLSCLAESAKTCQPAKATVAYTLDMMGVNYNFSDYYEIKNATDGKCPLYMKTNNVTVSYSAAAKQGLLGQGMTEVQVAEFEKSGTTDAQKGYNGKDATCLFSQNSALTKILTEWQVGDRVSTIITSVAKCSGPLMNSSIGGSGSTQINIGN